MHSTRFGAANRTHHGAHALRAKTTRRRLVPVAAALAAAMCACPALAAVNVDGSQPVEPDSFTQPAPRHRTLGMTTDLGVPDGAALGLVVRPKFDWLRLGVAGTYNGMAPGARVAVTIDPIAFPVGPTFTVEGGHSWEGRLPIGNAPTLSYTYANFHLGVEVGNRATFRFFLRGGASWLDGGTANFQSGNGGNGGSGLLGNPSYRGWLAPSGKLGFAAYF